MEDEAPPNGGSPGDRFASTHWSLVRAAGDSADPRRDAALADLCRAYWPPVYAFVRRRSRDADAALDRTQGFFARFLEKDDIRDARQERGRFRAQNEPPSPG